MKNYKCIDGEEYFLKSPMCLYQFLHLFNICKWKTGNTQNILKVGIE